MNGALKAPSMRDPSWSWHPFKSGRQPAATSVNSGLLHCLSETAVLWYADCVALVAKLSAKLKAPSGRQNSRCRARQNGGSMAPLKGGTASVTKVFPAACTLGGKLCAALALSRWVAKLAASTTTTFFDRQGMDLLMRPLAAAAHRAGRSRARG